MVETLAGTARSLSLRGIEECNRGNFRDAVRLLERAAREAGDAARLEPRALSAYGVALAATEKGRTLDAIAFCSAAVKRDVVDPELYLGLARAYLLARSRRRAILTLDEGLRVEPEHLGLRLLRAKLGLRSRPPIGLLARGHPLNRWLGRLRHRLKRGSGADDD